MVALLPYEKGKELLEIFAKYDTYREVYYEGFGYATADMVERIEEYMPIQPMIEDTRIYQTPGAGCGSYVP